MPVALSEATNEPLSNATQHPVSGQGYVQARSDLSITEEAYILINEFN
jgi:hypothetical protein